MKRSNPTFLALMYLLLLLILPEHEAYSQQLLNLNFEKTSIEHSIRPWGWELETDAPTTISMDSITKTEGKYSFKMHYNSEEKNEAIQTMSFGIEPFEFRNKTINLRGRIKTEKLNGFAYVSVNSSGEDKSGMVSDKISSTTDWQEVSLSFFVQDAIEAITLSLHHQGEGTAWFDDFHLIAENKEYSEVQIAEAFSKKQLRWIKKASAPLRSVDAAPNNTGATTFKDLTPLKKMIGNAKIIALGESTHGTSEFFRLKHRILEYSVKELGVRIFGIEGNMLTVQNVNKYILGGTGTAKASMRGIFMVWYNEEVLNMIEWVRNYNDQHPNDPVEFVGYDMQDLKAPMDSLYGFLEKKSPELLRPIASLLADLKENGNNYFMMSDSTKLEWYKDASKALNIVRSHENEWLTRSKIKADSMEVHWGIQYANLVKQFAENAYKGHLSFYRDEAMAENISWVLSHRESNTRMLIWAHDYHISRGEHSDNDLNIYMGLSMGAYLSKKFGDNYKAFAISTYEGHYLGMIGYQNFKQVNCPLYEGPKGTLDEALHQLSLKNNAVGVILDLGKARSEHWLTKPLPMRFANHVNIEYGYWTRYAIPFQFDGILFVDKTTSANQLRN